MKPFSRLSTEVIVDNAWHRYCRDRYVHRDGSEGDYFYVDMPGSCGIIPVLADGRTVLLKVQRYLLETELWEFPIGGMKPGEDALAVAKKELAEEAGYRAARWDALGSFAPYKGVSNEHCHFFLARDLEDCGQELESSEAIEVHLFSMAEARERLLGQELPDGQSMAGLMLLERSGLLS
ncbi:MAG: NUDIX domain-containing protein [Planctomycetota bacterium]|jgi:ADP-ribose pyrophosphatase